MDAGERRDRARRAEQMEAVAARLSREPAARTCASPSLTCSTMASKISSSTSWPPNFSASVTTPMRQRGPDARMRSRSGSRPSLRAARQPDDFGRAAADVEQQRWPWRPRSASAAQPAAARWASVSRSTISSSSPSSSRDAGEEFGAVVGRAARLGRDQPRARDAARAPSCRGRPQAPSSVRRMAASPSRPDCAQALRPAARCAKRRRRCEIRRARGPRNQQPAIVGAQIERRIGGRRPARRPWLRGARRANALPCVRCPVPGRHGLRRPSAAGAACGTPAWPCSGRLAAGAPGSPLQCLDKIELHGGGFANRPALSPKM